MISSSTQADKLLTPLEWGRDNYKTCPPLRTIRRWIQNGNIQPQPIKHGREYRIRSSARYYDTETGLLA